MSKDAMIRWNLFLPPETVAELRAIAEKRGTNSSELVRRAIKAYLKALANPPGGGK